MCRTTGEKEAEDRSSETGHVIPLPLNAADGG